jgi:hypothetical protein
MFAAIHLKEQGENVRYLKSMLPEQFHFDIPVKFHKADNVNLIVISTTFVSVLVLTIDRSLRMYLGVDPRTVVSDVEILLAEKIITTEVGILLK